MSQIKCIFSFIHFNIIAIRKMIVMHMVRLEKKKILGWMVGIRI